MKGDTLDKWLLTVLLLAVWIITVASDFVGIKLSLDTETIQMLLLGAFIAEVKHNSKNGNGGIKP